MIYTALLPLEKGEGKIAPQTLFSLEQETLSTVGDQWWTSPLRRPTTAFLHPSSLRGLPEAGSTSSSSKIEKKQTRSVNPVNSEKIPLDYHWIVALNYLILAWSVPEISRRFDRGVSGSLCPFITSVPSLSVMI